MLLEPDAIAASDARRPAAAGLPSREGDDEVDGSRHPALHRGQPGGIGSGAILRVRLLSISPSTGTRSRIGERGSAQPAEGSAPVPGCSAPPLPATMASIPRAMRRSTFSRKTTHAITAVKRPLPVLIIRLIVAWILMKYYIISEIALN